MQQQNLLRKERIRKLLKGYSAKRKKVKKSFPSAVLVPLVEHQKDLCILFIKRTDLVKYHKGEISYPGGTKDHHDRNLRETLLREINEELGINSAKIEILGSIDEQITVTNFLVRPYIGYLPFPINVTPDPFEIADIIIIPIHQLLYQPVHKEVIMRNRTAMILYTYYYEKYTIWGATARILHNFFEIIKGTKIG